MPVLAFPPQALTADEVAAITARVERGGHYRCLPAVEEGERPAITLVNAERQERGRIVKRHGVYAVLDAHGHAVLRTRRLDEVLAVLTT
jgi:acyl-CoA synthetase (NDP forming)